MKGILNMICIYSFLKWGKDWQEADMDIYEDYKSYKKYKKEHKKNVSVCV